jgi:hypothetical protein
MTTETITSSRTSRAVFFLSPAIGQFHYTADDVPSWCVFIGDADANPIGQVYDFTSYTYAAELARSLAREHNLELIDDALPF